MTPRTLLRMDDSEVTVTVIPKALYWCRFTVSVVFQYWLELLPVSVVKFQYWLELLDGVSAGTVMLIPS